MLEPGQGNIKPQVDTGGANILIEHLYGLKAKGGVSGIKEFVSYDDKNFFFKPDDRYFLLLELIKSLNMIYIEKMYQ